MPLYKRFILLTIDGLLVLMGIHHSPSALAPELALQAEEITGPASIVTTQPQLKVSPASTTSPVPSPASSVRSARIELLADAYAEDKKMISHLYSSVSPFNKDASLVLLESDGGTMQIRDLGGVIIQNNLGRHGILPLSDPVWSRKEAHILYYHAGNSIYSYNAMTDTRKLLYSLAAYTAISFGYGEGDISADGDRLAVIADKKSLFYYAISSDDLVGPIDISGRAMNSFDISASGRYLILDHELDGQYHLDLYDEHGLFKEAFLDYSGHGDRGRDSQGSDIIVLTNSNDPTPIPNCQNGIVKVAVPSGVETCLLELDWSLAVHVSCSNIGQDWCLVSTYDPKNPHSQVRYANQVLMVSLRGDGVVSVGPTRSSNSSYTAIPRAAVSPDGRYAVFASDNGRGPVSTHLVRLPQF